jgi:rhodanese-related sulfurtransferase
MTGFLAGTALLAMVVRASALEIEPFEAWDLLRDDPRVVLVDVATETERTEDGVPDLTSLGREVVLLPVLIGPGATVDPGFVPALLARFAPGQHRPIFVCRLGVRSLAAARAAREAGFADAVSIVGGMMGPDASDGRRGALMGWRAGGLPWRAD